MWKRQANLIIGKNLYSLDNMNFNFKVRSEDRAKVSEAKFEVYNLSPSTRAGIQKNDPIILTAGYKGDVGGIFVGAVADFVHDYGDLDIITKITAIDSMDAWLGTDINKTYSEGTYAADIIDDLLTIFGVEVAMVKLAENKYYPGCRVCRGKLKDILTEIVCRDCKSRFLIRHGQIIINPPEEGITTGYLLTPETGLLKASSSGENQTVNNDTSAVTKTRSQQADADGIIKRECLLNPRIGVADLLDIRDKTMNGIYLVKAIEHEGSRTGPWKSSLEVLPAA